MSDGEISAIPNVSSFAFWSQPASVRAPTFAELRRSAPVSFQEPSAGLRATRWIRHGQSRLSLIVRASPSLSGSIPQCVRR